MVVIRIKENGGNRIPTKITQEYLDSLPKYKTLEKIIETEEDKKIVKQIIFVNKTQNSDNKTSNNKK